MDFKFAHTNINVLDIAKSLQFYEAALGLVEAKRKKAEDGSFELVFLTDAEGQYQLELTWLADRTTPYDLSDNEIHIAFMVKDIDEARKLHRDMGVIALENTDMGIYFIEDPDGYWLEIVPDKT